MELFRVVVKSGIIYFTTSKDIRVTVGGSRTTFFKVIFGIFPKVELPTSRYFENSQSLGILISQRLGNIPIFGKFQFPTIRRNFHIFSITYLREDVSLHFLVGTSLFFSFPSILQSSTPRIKTMVSEEEQAEGCTGEYDKTDRN